MSDSSSTQDHPADELVGRLAEEFLERLRRGEKPTAEQYAKRHPEVAELIRQVFPSLEVMGWAEIAPSDDSSSDAPSANAGSPARPASSWRGELGDYRILREIGRGGMGVVYEAEQISLGRRVALKVLPFAAVLDRRQLKRFQNEAQAAAGLHHTNIVPVHGIGCERGVHYYAMQYVEGQTLAEVIKALRQLAQPGGGRADRPSDQLPAANPSAAQASDAEEQSGLELASRFASGQLVGEPVDLAEVPSDHAPTSSPSPSPADPSGVAQSEPSPEPAHRATATVSSQLSSQSPTYFRSIAELGIQVAEALEHAHDEGVVHRDIKPSNLILDPQGKVWITDFGLARIENNLELTMTGDLVGTLRYMSPEQALAKLVLVDHRTDIYSLGVTLYELLTLQVAFAEDGRQELLQQIVFEEPTAPRKLNRSIPAELGTIVSKAMAKNPADRYATAQHLADDLKRYLEDKPIKARPPSLLQRSAKWARRHRPLVASAGVVLVVITIGAVVSTILLARSAHLLSQAAQRADRNSQRARQAVDEYFTLVSESTLLREEGMQPLRKELLEAALRYYQEFAQEQTDDPELLAELAATHSRIAMIQIAVDSTDWVQPFHASLNINVNGHRLSPIVSVLDLYMPRW